MNICVIAHSPYKHDSRIVRETKALRERGARIDVVSLRRDDSPPIEAYEGVTIYGVSRQHFRPRRPHEFLLALLVFLVRATIQVTRLSLKTKYDLVHVHNIPDFLVFAAIVPRLRGAKIILDIHDLVPEYYRRKFQIPENHLIAKGLLWTEALSCRFASHVITTSERWRKRLIERSVPKGNCSVVMNVPDPDLFKRCRSNVRKKSRVFSLCYPGTISEQHGVDILIRALVRVKQEVPEIRLTILGDDRDGRAQELVKQLKLDSFISIEKPVPVDQLPSLIEAADAGVVPQRGGLFVEEAVPTKLMEFAMMGIPAVASRIVATEDYFDDSMVMFFEPEDEEDLAKKIITLSRDPERAKTFARNADRFTMEHNWAKYKGVLHNLVGQLMDGNGSR